MIRIISIVGLLLAASPAAAQFVESTRAVGMGDAVRGDPVGASALMTNPAGMSRGMAYSAEGQFSRDAIAKTNVGSVSIVDSKTQPALAVGVAYGYVFSDGSAPNDVAGHDVRLAFANAAIANQLHIGLGAHYVTLDRGEDLESLEGFTLDLGLLYSVSGNFSIGLVGENLIEIDDPALRRRLGGGIGVIGGAFSLDADLMYDMGGEGEDPKPDVAIGVEALLAKTAPFRVGYTRLGRSETQYFSGGLGYISASGGSRGNQLNLGVRVNSDDSKDFLLSAALTMFL